MARSDDPEGAPADPPPMQAARTLAIGSRVRDYEVEAILARGGCGVVYRVRHTVLGRPAAIKVLHPELASHDDAVLRFEREARAANLIRHPNVVDIYDFGRLPDGPPYFVMELLEGADLRTHIGARGFLTPQEARAILVPLTSALSAAHDKGIVHRDLKASNVFLSDDHGQRRVVLLDFGIAKLLDLQASAGITTSQHLLGTPSCMAPEQLTGGAVSPRTDVYALGALTFHMLVGGPAFPGEGLSALQYSHLYAERPRPSMAVAVSPALDDVVVRAMALRPEDRFEGASEFLAAYDRALSTDAGGSSGLEEICGVGIAIEVRPRPEALETPDPALIDHIQEILVRARGVLEAFGFQRVVETGTTLLCVRPIRGENAAPAGERRRAIELGRHTRAVIRERAGEDPRAHVNLAVHAGAVLAHGERVEGGDLTRLAASLPDADVEGLILSAAIAEGLGLTELESLGDGWFRCPPRSQRASG